MNTHQANIIVICGVLLACPVPSPAWGPEGHRIIGHTALSMVDEAALALVVDILGSDSPKTVGKACFWPDTVSKKPGWEWSAPQHYVNIPRDNRHYDRQRDCGDGICVTEAIGKYAKELSRPGLSSTERRQAFAWLCHLVGDLHQPLHAGYLDDRGGNNVNIEYKGKARNLHQFWDRALIRTRLGYGDSWVKPYGGSEWTIASQHWNPDHVSIWTDESHALVAASAYPEGSVIDEPFAEQSWLIIRQQWQKAAHRLALILNATIGEGRTTQNEAARPASQIPGDAESDARVPSVGLGG
jgi:hypothetical protein